MAEDMTRNELELRLIEQKGEIKRRLAALEGELSISPAAIKSRIKKNPWIGVSAFAVAGLVVGLVVAKSRRRSRTSPFHQQLVEQYIEAVGDDVRKRLRRGKAPEDAVRAALEERVPVIVYAPREGEANEPKSFIRQFGDLALTTALGFVLKSVMDLFAASFSVEKLQAMLAIEEERAEERSQSQEQEPSQEQSQEQGNSNLSVSGDGAENIQSPPVPRSEP